jgi:hypothetical protein
MYDNLWPANEIVMINFVFFHAMATTTVLVLLHLSIAVTHNLFGRLWFNAYLHIQTENTQKNIRKNKIVFLLKDYRKNHFYLDSVNLCLVTRWIYQSSWWSTMILQKLHSVIFEKSRWITVILEYLRWYQT